VEIVRVKSAVDWWLRITIWISVPLMLVIMLTVPPDEKMFAYAVGWPTLILILWIYLGTYYELRDDYLYCRSGPFFRKIPYDKIKSLRLHQSVLGSMALSTRRIEIMQHGKGYIRGTTDISPVNREEFLAELARRCVNLEKGTWYD